MLASGSFDGQVAVITGGGSGMGRAMAVDRTRPGLAACGIYLAIVAWSEFVFARTLVTKPANWLVTVGLQSFVGEYLVEWPALMAAGIVSLLPMFVLFVLLEPFLVSGLTSGAVKQ